VSDRPSSKGETKGKKKEKKENAQCRRIGKGKMPSQTREKERDRTADDSFYAREKGERDSFSM